MTNATIAAELAAVKPGLILIANQTIEMPYQELLQTGYRRCIRMATTNCTRSSRRPPNLKREVCIKRGRPHPGPLPQERETWLPRLDKMTAPDSRWFGESTIRDHNLRHLPYPLHKRNRRKG